MGYTITGLGEPLQMFGANVTANYFDMLGVKPILGRNFLPQEEVTADVAVVTEKFWRSKLNADPMVLGRNLTLNGVPTTIVGVLPNMPLSWFGPNSEVYTVKPFDLPGLTKERLMRGVSFMRANGRLKPGITVEQAQAAMPALQNGYKQERPDAADNTWASVLIAVGEDVTGRSASRVHDSACSGRGRSF